MAISDLLADVGNGVKTGARALGAAAQPIGQRTAQVLSGEAPQIDEESRQRQYQMEDQQLATKSQQLEQALAIGQKYGTLTPEQQQQYVDQISGLYSQPRHANVLMEKLRKAIHPQGAYAQGPQAPLANPVPAGGMAAADAEGKLSSLTQADELKKQQTLQSIDWFKKNMLPQFPPEQQAQKLNDYIDHANGLGKDPSEKPPKGLKAITGPSGAFVGVEDQDTGKQYIGAEGMAGAPPEVQAFNAAMQKSEKDKQAEANTKWEREQKEINERQQRSLANQSDRMISMFQNTLNMDQYKDALKQISAHETTYNGAVDLQKKMQGLLPAALAGNQQAQVGILADHIAMTTHQPGASMRPTQQLFNEAAGSQPTLEKYRKYFNPDVPGGFVSGLTLSKQEIQQMVDMAQVGVDAERETLQEMKETYQQQLNPEASTPGKKTGAKKVGGLLPKTGAQPVANPSDPLGLF